MRFFKKLVARALHLAFAIIAASMLASCNLSITDAASVHYPAPTKNTATNKGVDSPTTKAPETVEIEDLTDDMASAAEEADRGNEAINEFFVSQYKSASGITEAQLRESRVEELLTTIEQLMKDEGNLELAQLLLLEIMPFVYTDKPQSITRAIKILQDAVPRQSSVTLDLTISAPCAGFSCSGVSTSRLNTNSSLLVTVSDLAIKVWDFHTGEEVAQLGFHAGGVHDAAFSPSSRWVATVGGVASAGGYRDSPLKIWDLSAARPGLSPLHSFPGEAPGRCVDFSDSGEFLVYGDDDGFIYILSSDGEKLFQKLDAHTQLINDIAFSHDSQYVVSASADGTARLWSLTSSTPILSLEEHTGQINAVDFSPDNSQVATGSIDGTVKIWSLPSATVLSTLNVGSPVIDLAYYSDGSKILVASHDGKVGIWNASEGNRIVEFEIAEISGLEIASNDEKIVTTDWNKTVRIWDVELESLSTTPSKLDDLMARAATQVTRDLSSTECLKYLREPECNIRSRYLGRDDVAVQGELVPNQSVAGQLAAGERHAWVYRATSTFFDVILQSETALLLEIYDPLLGLVYISDDWILGQGQINGLEAQELQVYMLVVSASATTTGSYALEISAADQAE